MRTVLRVFALSSVLSAAIACTSGGPEHADESPTRTALGVATPGAASEGICGLGIVRSKVPESVLAAADTLDAGAPTTGISFALDGSIMGPDRMFIAMLLDRVREPLARIIGEPAQPTHVMIRYEPIQGFAGAYSPYSNELLLGSLPDLGSSNPVPDGGAPPRRDDPRRFTEMFVHELVHAYQDALVDRGWDAWAVEGMAVAATAIIREELGALADEDSRWSLENLSRNYDDHQITGAALAGSSYFDGPLISHRYLAAGGLFTLLAAAQAPGTATPGQRGYLATLTRRLEKNGASLRAGDVLAAIEESALAPVDGMPARSWTQQQPITDTNGAVGVHFWASMVQPIFPSDPLLTGWLFFTPLRRTNPGWPSMQVTSGTMTLTIFDAQGATVLPTQTVTLAPTFNGMQYLQLPIVPPGAYRVRFDATAVGGGITDYTFMRASAPSPSSANGIIAASVFEPLSGTLIQQPVTAPSGSVTSANGASFVVPSARTNAVTVIAPGGFRREITVAAPARRSVRIDTRGLTSIELPEPEPEPFIPTWW